MGLGNEDAVDRRLHVNLSTVKRSPHATDRHVGDRVRMRRKMQGMTQEKLAKRSGSYVSAGAEYEKGTNRIGASRLQHIASIQQVPISFFSNSHFGNLAMAAVVAGLFRRGF